VPRLYQKYVGHDNNRDFYMSTQAETININRVLYREWFPQIVFDHHQTGPAGTVMFAPPFRDPFNYVFDAIVPSEIDLIGAAMHTRLPPSEGGRDDAQRVDILDLVERWPAHDRVLPQPDRPADGDDWQPDAWGDSVRSREAAAERGSALSPSLRSRGTSGSRSSTR
jgi:hypothetical protein